MSRSGVFLENVRQQNEQANHNRHIRKIEYPRAQFPNSHIHEVHYSPVQNPIVDIADSSPNDEAKGDDLPMGKVFGKKGIPQ